MNNKKKLSDEEYDNLANNVIIMRKFYDIWSLLISVFIIYSVPDSLISWLVVGIIFGAWHKTGGFRAWIDPNYKKWTIEFLKKQDIEKRDGDMVERKSSRKKQEDDKPKGPPPPILP